MADVNMFLTRRTFYGISLLATLFLIIHVVITPPLADVMTRSLPAAMTTPSCTTPKPTSLQKFRSDIRDRTNVSGRNVNLEEQRKTVPGRPACSPHQNVAFMKVHKCGSTTTQNIFLRYGFDHDLVVALPRQASPWIGCGNTIRPQHTMKLPQGTKWNIFAHHSTYSRSNFERFMLQDTRFVAILRNPITAIKSAFNYFKLEYFFPGMIERTGSSERPIQTYLKNPTYWDGVFVGPRKCFQDECAKNCMAKDLGLQRDDGNSHVTIKHFIQGIENDFALVMIIEYFNHSLVMLKRRLCWNLSDIIYDKHQYKARNYDYKSSTVVTKNMEANYKRSSAVDHALYDYFNQSLWSQIEREGDDFLAEVRLFQTILARVWHYCAARIKQGKLRIKATPWNNGFIVNKSFCSRLGKGRWQWDRAIRRKLNRRFYHKPQAQAGEV